MRLANVRGRAVLLVTDDGGVDVAAATNQQFGPGLQMIYDRWADFRSWAESAKDLRVDVRFERKDLESPSPTPGQILAIGLNYADHAREAGLPAPEGLPPTFTKFVSSLSGPDTEVVLPPGGRTDWEVELVVVIGRETSAVPEGSAWDHVAGLAVGQDISERVTQLHGVTPQFSLGKSFAGFTPVGPWLVTADSVVDRDDLALGCRIDGEPVQSGRTSDLLLSVSVLISRLSRIVTLHPGDLIFTGTPAGVGIGRRPQRFLQPGERLTSWIEGIGELHQTFLDPWETSEMRAP